jgi:hypothetical protein
MAVDCVMESFFCNDNLIADSDYCITQWSKCHFSGRETFTEVKSRLSAYVHLDDLLDYMCFISLIPMMEYLFLYTFGEETDVCSIVFTMSMHSFIKYNKEVLVYKDLDVTLCGFNDESIKICERCLDNSNCIETYIKHPKVCPYFMCIFPDMHCNDIEVDTLFPSEKNSAAVELFLDHNVVDQMYLSAFDASRNSSYGI